MSHLQQYRSCFCLRCCWRASIWQLKLLKIALTWPNTAPDISVCNEILWASIQCYMALKQRIQTVSQHVETLLLHKGREQHHFMGKYLQIVHAHNAQRGWYAERNRVTTIAQKHTSTLQVTPWKAQCSANQTILVNASSCWVAFLTKLRGLRVPVTSWTTDHPVAVTWA